MTPEPLRSAGTEPGRCARLKTPFRCTPFIALTCMVVGVAAVFGSRMSSYRYEQHMTKIALSTSQKGTTIAPTQSNDISRKRKGTSPSPNPNDDISREEALSSESMVTPPTCDTWHPVGAPFVPMSANAAPNIAIIGTAKGGTSDIANVLTSAMGVTPAVTKELNDLPCRRRGSIIQKTCDGPFRKYMKRLRHSCAWTSTDSECIACMNGDHDHVNITVDATPVYLQEYGVPMTLKRVSPTTKVIVLLREPTDRAYSLFNHWQVEANVYGNATLQDSAQKYLDWRSTKRIATLHTRLQGQSSKPALAVKVYRDLEKAGLFNHYSVSLFEGAYYKYGLQQWLMQFFAPGNVLIIDSHEYFTARSCVMQHVSQFLYGRPLTPLEERKINALQVKNSKVASGNISPQTVWSNATKDRLNALFAPSKVELLSFLQSLRDKGYYVVGFRGHPWV
jgi:hypothetical protein